MKKKAFIWSTLFLGTALILFSRTAQAQSASFKERRDTLKTKATSPDTLSKRLPSQNTRMVTAKQTEVHRPTTAKPANPFADYWKRFTRWRVKSNR